VLALPFLLKNLTVWNAYNAARAYGFPRVYRRLAEASRRLVADPKTRHLVDASVREAIRSPSSALSLASSLGGRARNQSATVRFLELYVREALTASSNKAAPPSFARVLAEVGAVIG
jgi:hypothetical protein